MTIAVISTNTSCDSAKKLATAIKAKYFNLTNSQRRDFKEFSHVFKYGFSGKIATNNVFNTSKATVRAINKIETMDLFKDEPFSIKYTKNKAIAEEWINSGRIAVARTTATGTNGEGLTYCETIQELNNNPAKFWTRYVNHTNELRVNMWRGEVISIYDKIQHEDGTFRFKLWQGQEKHPQLVSIAEKIWKKVKLDWCGADILRDANGDLYLLEVNSAPVLYPFTLEKLRKHILRSIANEEN
jgi:glutathione synthase/RimK-type ligase-like ATP-grasp enzyme